MMMNIYKNNVTYTYSFHARIQINVSVIVVIVWIRERDVFLGTLDFPSLYIRQCFFDGIAQHLGLARRWREHGNAYTADGKQTRHDVSGYTDSLPASSGHRHGNICRDPVPILAFHHTGGVL